MKYFALITEKHLTLHNKLEKAVREEAIRSFDRRLLEGKEELKAFTSLISGKIEHLNASHPRCKPIRISIWKHRQHDNDTNVDCGHVFKMMIYQVKGGE